MEPTSSSVLLHLEYAGMGAWGWPLGFSFRLIMMSEGASAWGVSLVQVQGEGLGIVGNPSTAPLLGAGVDVDEGRIFLLAMEGSIALLAPWPP